MLRVLSRLAQRNISSPTLSLKRGPQLIHIRKERIMAAVAPTQAPTPLAVITDEDFGDLAAPGNAGFSRPNYEINQRDLLGPIAGLTNYTPWEMAAMSDFLEKIRRVFKIYGFTGIVSPPFEYAQLLLKKGGIDKQIYGVSRLQDGSLTKLGIPFDHTVPTAIFVAKNSDKLVFPYKRNAIGYSCRGEHAVAGKGRYRGFIQCDVDVFDRELTAGADAETLTATIQGLEALGIKNCQVYLNHVDIARAFVREAGVLDSLIDTALRIIDKLKPDNRNEVIAELTQKIPNMTEEQADQLLKNMDYEGPLSAYQFANPPSEKTLAAFKHLQEVEKTCLAMGVKDGILQFSTKLTRGLDYYTGIVAETFIKGQEKLGSIASGGRYDDLVDGLGEVSQKVQGVGFSIGLTRLFDVLKALNLVDLSRQSVAEVFVGYRTKEEGCYEKALEVATALRAMGLSVELYTAKNVKVSKELDVCNRKGIPCSVMVMTADEIQVGNMATGEKTLFPTVSEVMQRVQELRKAGVFKFNPSRNKKDSDDSKQN